MDPNKLKQLINNIKSGKISVEEAYSRLKSLPYEDLGFAKLDHHRHMRKGFPEVVFCQGKSIEHISKIAKRFSENKHDLLATRADEKAYRAIKKSVKNAKYHKEARIVTARAQSSEHSCDNNGRHRRYPRC